MRQLIGNSLLVLGVVVVFVQLYWSYLLVLVVIYIIHALMIELFYLMALTDKQVN